MGNTAWIRRQVLRPTQPPEGILELGAGEGRLIAHLPGAHRRAGLDRTPRPPGLNPSISWIQSDALTFTGWSDFPVVVASLFLHHFERPELARLGRAFDQHARLIVAAEPARSRTWDLAFRLLCPLLRAHPVTRHDGRISIAAGFRRGELAAILELSPARWEIRDTVTSRGSYRFFARRRTT